MGSVASKKLNLYAPAAMVGYFDELANAMTTGQVDDSVLSKIASRYHMTILEEAPENYV